MCHANQKRSSKGHIMRNDHYTQPAYTPQQSRAFHNASAAADSDFSQRADAYETSYDQQIQNSVLQGRYRVMDECTTGGFGDILISWDTRLQRRVAIKRIPLFSGAEYGDFSSQDGTYNHISSTIQEALQEARAASRLSHPNIVSMYDFETDSMYAYLVMEYIDGLTLQELLGRVEGGTLTGDEASYVCRALCSALACAHKNRVLHLDIKPSNIMFDQNGCVKLCDFGMASLASATGYGDARGGTVGYMSCEQISGDLVDERSDIFSLATVMWQCLTGTCPFAANTAEASRKLIEKGIKKSLSDYACDLAPVSQTLVDQSLKAALTANPTLRCAHVENLSHQIGDVLGDENEGKRSIAQLVQQALETDEGAAEFDKRKLPFGYRHPHVLPYAKKVLNAICGISGVWVPLAGIVRFFAHLCAPCTYEGISFLTQGLGGTPLIVFLVCTCVIGVLSAFIPFGAVGVICLIYAFSLILHPQFLTGIGALLPVVLAVISLAWLIVCVRRNTWVSSCALIGIATQNPFMTPLVIPSHVQPLPACIHCFALWLIVHLTSWTTMAASNPQQVCTYLFHLIQQPALMTLGISVASTALAAYVLQQTQSPWLRYTVQIAASALMLYAFITSHTIIDMESCGIYSIVDITRIALALCLSILMFIVMKLDDSQPAGEEIENVYELN